MPCIYLGHGNVQSRTKRTRYSNYGTNVRSHCVRVAIRNVGLYATVCYRIQYYAVLGGNLTLTQNLIEKREFDEHALSKTIGPLSILYYAVN